ncbi:hypothetical protein EB796_021759 [Bugula neritina]|uniref:Uncharacterized protein n=1 Tax=Bugula neritina TaxID=10212 RepID=A0A7J7J190_BUGNE|nr:hypothetical protein EB796_021759 [Bugula neritina]
MVDLKATEGQDIQTLQKSKEYFEKKCEQLSTQYKKVLNQLQEEQAMNRSLLNNQQHWQSAVQRLEEDKQKQEKELKDTQEQLRDILFHLEAQNKLSSENTGLDAKELEDGQISVGASSTPQSRRRSRRKK